METRIQDVLSGMGLDSTHVKYIVEGLMMASLRGIDTHGVELLPVYVRELTEGRSNRKPNFGTERQGVILRLDADHALGLVAGRIAVEQGMDICRSEGLALVSVANSNHFGMASVYTLIAAKSGYVCLGMSHTDALVAPSNGAEKLLGTNPLSFAAPAMDNDGFCLDMASSQVSFSAVQACLKQNKPLQRGWAIDAEGHDSAESRQFYALQPVGGYKGQGIAMMVTVLAGILSGMPLDYEMLHLFSGPYDKPRLNGHFFLLINPEFFGGSEAFKRQNQSFIDRVRNCRRADKDIPVRVPGDMEADFEKERLSDGIPVSEALAAYLNI